MVMQGIQIANMPDVLVKYRRWPQQMTSTIVDTVDCHATRLRSEMLEWFGIPKHEQDMLAHMMVSPCYWPIERRHNSFTFEQVQQWLTLLRNHSEVIANSSPVECKLNPASMRKMLALCEDELRILRTTALLKNIRNIAGSPQLAFG